MKMKVFLYMVTFLFVLQVSVHANRQLDLGEIQQIMQDLTSQPRDTWIPGGTIEAVHRASDLASGHVTHSTVAIKYDGNRFLWQIDIDSRTKQAEPKKAVGRRVSHSTVDLDWNAKRVFIWDGQRYTIYFRSGNHAIVTEQASDTPVIVNGPLTAGIIPWGYGIFTFQSLLDMQSSATEIDVNGDKQIELRLTDFYMPELVLVLDPALDYAALSYEINTPSQSSIRHTYGNHKMVSGRWVPQTIMIERLDCRKQPPEVISSDFWDITSINTNIPPADSFEADYEVEALVEYKSPVTNKPLMYRHSNEIDNELLLEDRLRVEMSKNREQQNCATKAMKYVACQLGMNADDPNLAELAEAPGKATSLYDLQQFAKELGFHAIAGKTNIEALKDLSNCRAILHLSSTNHYVVLGHIDRKSVWVIDLDSNKFYYPIKFKDFEFEWSQGTVLLVSNEPVNPSGEFTLINDNELYKIMGASGGAFGNYSCTDQIQTYNVTFCSAPISGLCGSLYTIFYNRYACELDEADGSCYGDGLVGRISSPCINDPYDPTACMITGKWISRYIHACL